MKSKKNKYNLFTDSGCLTQEAITGYLSGTLTDSDAQWVHKHAQQCNLCNEALKGAGHFTNYKQFQQGVAILRQQWNDRPLRERKISRATWAATISVAATIALLLVFYFGINYQKSIQRKYIASVYQRGSGIDQALEDNSIYTNVSGGNLQSAADKYEEMARNSYIKCYRKPDDDEIPVALMDETTVVAHADEQYAESLPKKNDDKAFRKSNAVLRYPYRVMSMPPPENTGDEKENRSDKLFYIVEEMPRFQGKGVKYFSKFLQENIRYPSKAMEKNISGRVYVQFVIDETGKVTKASILKGSHQLLDQEVLRVVNASPLWQPGRQQGRAVKVSMVIPVDFVLY